MFRSSFEFDTQALIDAERNLVSSPKLMQRALKRRESRLKKLTLSVVQVEPGPPRYPIRWKSRRQQRAYFATNGFGKGIPYQRTGGLNEAWNVKFSFDADGGDFLIENTSDVATYVIGENQQPFHADTGWIDAAEVIDNEVVPLVLNDFEETFYTVADPFVRRP